jgi:hypothetical protein
MPANDSSSPAHCHLSKRSPGRNQRAPMTTKNGAV